LRSPQSNSRRASRCEPRSGFAAASLLLALLCACSHHEGEGTVRAGSHDSAAAYDPEKLLDVYSWADYIAPDTVSNFEKETGIKVRYDVYDNNEVLETKLLSGHSNYDVVVPSDVFFDRQRAAGVYRELDKHALPNIANADPEIMRQMAVHDSGNRYAIPYMWSTTGLGYNIDLVRERLGGEVPDSWALLFDPRIAAKLKDCGIPSSTRRSMCLGPRSSTCSVTRGGGIPGTCWPPRRCCRRYGRSCATSTLRRSRRSPPVMCASSSPGRAMWKRRAIAPPRLRPVRALPT
jgi:spermidine/putrescine-binding protein